MQISRNKAVRFSNLEWSKTENIIRLLEDAVKDMQKTTNYAEAADANIKNDEIINGLLQSDIPEVYVE